MNHLKTNSLSRKVSSLGGHICNSSGQLVQDLSLWLGESWNLKNCLLNLQLNYICQISNKNLKLTAPWMLYFMLKLCLKSLFFRLEGLIRFLWEICLFHLEGGTFPPYCALQFLPIISIGVNRLFISMVFVLNKTLTKKVFLFTCMPCD